MNAALHTMYFYFYSAELLSAHRHPVNHDNWTNADPK